MKGIFVNTNILIDLLADRKPFSKFAIELFKRAENKEITIYASSHSIATTHYLLKKYMEEKELRIVLYNLVELITIIPIDQQALKKGLKSKHKDFEDSLQIFCAYSIDKIECIVTRNIKDFKNSDLPVFSSDEIVGKI